MNVQIEVPDGVQDFVTNIKNKFKGRIKKAVLFGSTARNEAGTESDVDVLIIVDKKDSEIVKEIEDASLETMPSGLLVSPVIISETTYNDMRKEKYPFILNVEREGSVLV